MKTRLAVVSLLLVLVFGALACWATIVHVRKREASNRQYCANCMIALGQAMLLYENENNGRYPPGLQELLKTQDTGSEVFICRSSGDTKAEGRTLDEIARNLAGEHLSYVYVGNGMSRRLSPNVVLMYEKPTNHRDGGVNVLFGDGHVELFEKELARQIIAELRLGHNPPTTAGNPVAGRGRVMEKAPDW
jgi:prepilin-type processing-associated H-X9-DG protein